MTILQHPRAPVTFMGDRLPGTSHLVKALAGDVAPDTCSGCGEPIALHFDTTGCLLVGCVGAIARRELGLLENVHCVSVWGDQHPVESRAISNALKAACGPAMAIFVESLSHEELIAISRTLAGIVTVAQFREGTRR